MALISCPACYSQVSGQAQSCPKCGHPICAGREDAAIKKPFEYQLDILRDEIGTIHTRIGAFDTLSFQVKGWTLTLWAAVAAWSVTQKNILGVALTIPLLLILWALDAFFKTYQQRVRARMGVIEGFLNRPARDPGPSLEKACANRSFGSFVVHDPMCNQTFDKGDNEFQKWFTRKVSFWRALGTSNVYLVYGVLIASSLVIMACLYWKLV